MTTQLHCAQCGAILTDDDIYANQCERDLSYPGEWEPERWCCFDCSIRAQLDTVSK